MGWNFVGDASNNEEDSDNTMNQSSEPRSRSNGGINWSEIEVISEPVLGQNLNTGLSSTISIAVEGDKIYVVWTDNNNTNNAGTDEDIFYRYFDGNVWADVQVINEPVSGQNFNTPISRWPAIAVENGKIYVVWYDRNSTYGWDDDIFFRCNLTGSSWEDIQVISEPVVGQNINTESSQFPKIDVENGKIYVIWTDANNTNGCGGGILAKDIFYRCNLTGSSWEPVQVISEPVFGQNINTGDSWTGDIVVENGKIYVTWWDNSNINGAGTTDRDIFFRENLTGTSWEDIQVISEPIPGQNLNIENSENGVLAVENGIIYVVWDDTNNTNGAGTDGDIFYRVNLTGTSWEPVQVISEPVPGSNFNTGSTVFPGIAVEKGRIYVVWSDNNATNNAGTDSDIFYRCNITGINWEPMQVISEPVFGQNFNTAGTWFLHPQIAISDKLHVVWEEENNTKGSGTDHDINYRWKKVVLPSLFLRSPKVNPRFGNTSTEFNFTVTYTQLNNTPSSRMIVKIDGNENSMMEYNPMDTNYTDGKKYYFKVKNLDIGTHTYEFNASDGTNYTNSRLFSYYPYVTNTIPEIITEDNLTAIEDQYYETNYEFEDMDIDNVGQAYHWEFATNATWLNFDLILGKLNGTPQNDDVGEYWVYIAVNDTMYVEFTNFTLTVIEVNDNPIIITNNLQHTYEDELYEVDYSATDIDSLIDNQLWSLETNATSWLNISSTSGILNGTPTNDDVGDFWVNVTVADGEGGADFTNFTLTVLNVNDNPEIITSDILIAETDKLYEVQYNATDIDSPISQFTWTLNTNATWLQIDSSTGLLNGTSTRNEAGWYNVNVTVSDGDSGLDWHEFILTVYKGNLPPIITTEDVETAMVNKTYKVDYNATDDKPLVWLSWSLETNASWLSLDSTTGVLSGTPTIDDGGKQYWVNISVSDGDNAWTHHNFSLTVLREPKMKNKIPNLSAFEMVPAEGGDTDTEFTFTVHYFDFDNETPEIIQVVIDGKAYDMSLEYGGIIYNGRYEYKTKLSEGVHTYYFTASDGSDSNTSETFTTPNINPLMKPVKPETGSDINTQMYVTTVSLVILILIISIFISGTEVGKYKFVTLFFVPLYNRLHPENILNNYTRGQIHGYIKAKPGEHYSAIMKALELNNGTLAHHAKVLEKEGYIYSQHDGFHIRFYPKGIKKTEPDTLKQNLIDIIRQQPGISQREIISLLDSDASQQVISYNLIKLTRDGTIKLEHNGRENRYSINYEEIDSYPDEHQDQTQGSDQSPPSIQPQQQQETIPSKQSLPKLPPFDP